MFNFYAIDVPCEFERYFSNILAWLPGLNDRMLFCWRSKVSELSYSDLFIFCQILKRYRFESNAKRQIGPFGIGC
ncbi:hypothetical protein AXFE_35390 [Acidithrix ferrooxidans]|uniref:Uncharacterized protein n=1 Tax=Acidithrix ferrooxidans TaxID=1280514 RepID=A0A0D8HCB9_9ACTN|nr:hypothetical protein AXFE_35390 [Acidithrix ferrooxidans]CAG4928553.1 unnamed protein product [Acidithrix sp. C25]